MNRADNICDEFDAAVFSGDAFIALEDARLLKNYAERWLREADERIKELEPATDAVGFMDLRGVSIFNG